MRMNLPRMSTLLLAALALAPAGCTYYQTAPGVYAPTPSAFDRSWSAAVGALEDEGVHVVDLDRASGTASGSRGSIGVTARVRTQADGSVRVEFNTRGNTAADPTLIDRITQRYNQRM